MIYNLLFKTKSFCIVYCNKEFLFQSLARLVGWKEQVVETRVSHRQAEEKDKLNYVWKKSISYIHVCFLWVWQG